MGVELQCLASVWVRAQGLQPLLMKGEEGNSNHWIFAGILTPIPSHSLWGRSHPASGNRLSNLIASSNMLAFLPL